MCIKLNVQLNANFSKRTFVGFFRECTKVEYSAMWCHLNAMTYTEHLDYQETSNARMCT